MQTDYHELGLTSRVQHFRKANDEMTELAGRSGEEEESQRERGRERD